MKKLLTRIIPACILCATLIFNVAISDINTTGLDKLRVKTSLNKSQITSTENNEMLILNSSNEENEKIEYAHGASVDDEGDFIFSYNGNTYKNAFERLMAEDGFMYGVDWNYFGSWNNELGVLGDNNIFHKKSPYRPEYVERALYNMKTFGLNVMGCWIGPRGCFEFDEETGLITGLDDTFETNLVKLLESCRKNGMYIVPALLTHRFAESQAHDVYDNRTEQERYDWFVRFYYEEESREAFLNNGVANICNILKEYQDVIICVALTIENGSLANDIETGMMYQNRRGYTWENFATLQNAMDEVVKQYMPNMYTSCEDIGGWPDNMFKYNDLNVDLICPQQYRLDGNFWNQESFMAVRPGYLGEFNFSESGTTMDQYSIEHIDRVMERFYRSAIELGYLGAFNFGWSFGDANQRYSHFLSASTDDYESLRNYVIPVSYIIADSKHEYRGTSGKDVPVLLFNNDSENNYWIGGRNVDHFILERSDNGGKWHVIADNISPFDYQIDNGLIKYTDSTIKEGHTYRYRVTSVYEDGEKVQSVPGNEMKKFTPVECLTDSKGNYIGGFEDGALLGNATQGQTTGNSDGWYCRYGNFAEIRKGSDAHSGEYYLYGSVSEGITDNSYYSGQWQTDLTLESNTMYTLSFYSKNSTGMISVTVSDSETGGVLCWQTYAVDQEKTDSWYKNTVTFSSPDHGKVFIKLMTTDKEDTEFYLDDFSIVEAR